MFRDLINQLAKGEKPDKKVLARKLEAALTKKLGVLQISYLSQPGDPKINPPTLQLLVAAAFLGDKETIQLSLDLLRTELTQRHGNTKNDAVTQATAAAKEETARLLSPFPEERARWSEVMAELEKVGTRKANGA